MTNPSTQAESTREAFGKALIELGEHDPRVVVLDADLAGSTRTEYFAMRFPDRFIEVGIAEANMMGIASGLAAIGKIPFATTFCSFASKQATNMICVSICYPKRNVKIVGAYAGLLVGGNGATHMALEDLAIMRSLPGMVVIEPADGLETRSALAAIAQYHGPVYLRLNRNPYPDVSPSGFRFQIGKATLLRSGRNVTLIACGVMVSQAMLAAVELDQQGVEATVINCSCIKPLDSATIIEAASRTNAVVTCENHNIHGGLGSAVAEILSEHCPTPIVRVGVRDVFGECGDDISLMKKYHLTPADIAQAARRVLKRGDLAPPIQAMAGSTP